MTLPLPFDDPPRRPPPEATLGPPRLFTIEPGIPFVDALANGILAQAADDPLSLARTTVLLPTRRACRSLRDAFLRLSDGQALLLPRMSPIGDLDADEVSLGLEAETGLGGSLDPSVPIAPVRRQLLLAQAILRVPDLAHSPDQAVRLASELARLLDQVRTERLSFTRLADLVPDHYAEHWQKTLAFLRILTEHWPDILEAEGTVDGAERRNRVLEAQAAVWRAVPPTDPVIAAGSTGSIPATADLLAVIARLPKGAVILPGLDRHADTATWDALDPSHPQYGLSRLLRHLGVAREAVRPWPHDLGPGNQARARLIAEAMRPASTSEAWRDLADAGSEALDPNALDGLHRIDCPTPGDEAGVIALILRRTLETPGKRAALVTPDRALARRVTMALRRWGIEIDDSGGRPLAETAVGAYLRLSADFAAAAAAPLPLLALFKHPLCAGGDVPARFRTRTRRLERAVLRGPRPGAGFGGLDAALRQAEDARFDGDPSEGRADLLGWLDGLATLAAPFMEALAGPPRTLKDWLHLHVAFAEALAASDTETGRDRLWRHEDGEAAAAFINELSRAAEDFPPIEGRAYPALFAALMTGRVVRPRYGSHPRLAILGLLEARLLQYDVMILGGLNEGTWPPEPPIDPWMSRPMRVAFGLPAPERQIGLAAHDFAQAASGGTVVLTRAERVDGTPTVPSRWLMRLDTVLRGAGLDGDTEPTDRWLAWVAAMDQPGRIEPIAAPAPKPPVTARPRRLSVTAVETWMRDPYAIYARHILHLRPLDPIDADPGAAERGQFIHKALDAFAAAFPDHLPQDAAAELRRLGTQAFGALLAQPDVWAFWWPRFERIADWFVARERDRRASGHRTVGTEANGRLTLTGPGGDFLLTATADRIDRRADGTLEIIDYKTGTPPSAKEVQLGFAPQLPLEAVIAQAGGFGGLAAETVGALAFWKLSGGDPAGEEVRIRDQVEPLAEAARAGLEALIRTFDDPRTPYRSQPRPDHAPRHSDYRHLARIQEWSAGGGDGAE